ncbi:hypothetical protein SAMN05428966_102149 [Massilia sp. PDC64]|nr:hypothetical protein [Massilia sp. PDC64]SDC70310.1 hypothetical protein SAMN05428966_102149 [Massilia sp. PDC64]
MIVARIARRLVRKLIKPFALWLADLQIAEAEAHAEHYARLRGDLVGMEKDMRVYAVVLIARRNEIRTW